MSSSLVAVTGCRLWCDASAVPSGNVLRTAVSSVEQHLNPRFCLERRMRLLCLQLQLKPNGTGARRMTDGDEPVKWGHFFFISFS
jgi:hypothetical protein